MKEGGTRMCCVDAQSQLLRRIYERNATRIMDPVRFYSKYIDAIIKSFPPELRRLPLSSAFILATKREPAVAIYLIYCTLFAKTTLSKSNQGGPFALIQAFTRSTETMVECFMVSKVLERNGT